MIVNILGRLVPAVHDGEPQPEDYSDMASYAFALGKFDMRVGNPLRALVPTCIESFKLRYVQGWMGRE